MAIREIFAKEARRYEELRSSENYSRSAYERPAAREANEVELASALLNLSAMLHRHYGIAPIIIIDGYDTPYSAGLR